MKPTAIATVPPHAPFLERVARHPIVSGLRLNTVMPLDGNATPSLAVIEQHLERLQDIARDKPLWIDLKYRQLRTVGYAQAPFTPITLSHIIEVDTPTDAYFNTIYGGKERITILHVDHNKLIVQEGPKRLVGPGESVNIPDESLLIYGGLTELDEAYIHAAKKVGIHTYMQSFVESSDDLESVLEIDPNATIIAKIESKRGLEYVRQQYQNNVRLMAARGDLYIELDKPHEIIPALEDIIKKDKTAIVASRLFPSLAYKLDPNCEDIGDVNNLMRMGYNTFMFGDEVCQEEERIMSALNLFHYMAEQYGDKK